MSIDFDPIIADLVDYTRYPVIKLASGLYSVAYLIIDNGATTKEVHYGDMSGQIDSNIEIYGTVTQYHQDGMQRWVAGAPEYHEVG